MLIDTHAHVNFAAFKIDADEVIRRALEKNISLVNVGSQYSTSLRAVAYAEKYSREVYPHTKADINKEGSNLDHSRAKNKNFGVGVYAAIGLHPVQLKRESFLYHDSEELDETEIKTTGEEFDYGKYLELAQNPKVVAIGEVGLDYHHFEPEDNIEELKTKQKEIFLEFIRLANEVEKPLMIHCWDGLEDLLEILEHNPVNKKGVIHNFSGSYKMARKFIDLGFKIGLNGVITYTISYDRLIKEIELKDMVLETDCPYLTPVPHKGERNEPVYVELVAQKIAAVKNMSLEEVAEVTTENAKNLFNI